MICYILYSGCTPYRMERNNSFEQYRSKSLVEDGRLVLEDLFSFILKILSEHVFISCETNYNTTKCEIHTSSNEANAILEYHKNIAHSMGAYENYLNRLISGTSLDMQPGPTEFTLFRNHNPEENGQIYLMNDILSNMFCVILDLMSGITLFTSQTHLNYREYNFYSSDNRPSLYLVYSDSARDINKQFNRKKSLINSSDLQPKKLLDTGDKSYSESIPCPATVKNHETIHTGERRYKCNYCEKSFTHSSDVKRHERSHTEDRSYKCSFCEKLFFRAEHVKRHEKIHTGEKPFKCKYCEKTFTLAAQVTIHERTHTGERPYKCNYCEKSFKYSSDVKNHERTHTGERPYKCRYCGKTFSLASQVHIHERIHTGERPYKCRFCEKTFSVSSHVNVHERIHTGEGLHKCGYCEKTFATPREVKRHERMHTGERPFKCKYCDRSFTQFCSRRYHEKTHNKE